jgi:N-dimethylarginine dimethylaminohydrolase
MSERELPAAYGGPGWAPRPTALAEEMGTLWGDWGLASEWGRLEAVLLHAPGPEVEGLSDADAALMLQPLDPQAMRREHQALREAYRQEGVAVHLLEPGSAVPPNTLFCRDLFFMTPEGAVLARPAGRMRAGEERFVQARLAALGVPILLSVHGRGTFEGADAIWLDPRTVLLATGLRTNEAGAAQVETLLRGMGVEVIRVDLPYGSLHLLGTVNLAGPDLAVAWAGRAPHRAVETLRSRGFRVLFLPDEAEAAQGMALNFVPLEPNRVLMPAGCPRTRALYEAAGMACREIAVGALRQAAGGMGCLSGPLKRAAS